MVQCRWSCSHGMAPAVGALGASCHLIPRHLSLPHQSHSSFHALREFCIMEDPEPPADRDPPSLEVQSTKGAHLSNDTNEKRTPLLMQRPPSSGIDLMTFSFTKPVSHQKGFSLRGLPKQGSINPRPFGITGLEIPSPTCSEPFKSFTQDR